MPNKRKNCKTKYYTNTIKNKLEKIFGNSNVKKEWNVAKDSQDKFTREFYCPRLDIAVGPFNIGNDFTFDSMRIHQEIINREDFIAELINNSATEIGDLDKFLKNINKNPRCFLAIEIEHSGSPKHMLGDITNASIIGAIGVIIPMNDKKLKGFIKIKKYIEFATRVNKLPQNFNNIIIINKNDFLRILSEYKKDS